MISAVELAEQIMDYCSDEESLAVEIAILPIDNVDLLTSDEEVQDYDVMMNNEIPSDVCGMVQAQTNILNREHNDNKVEDDDNAKEEKTELRSQNEKEKRVSELLKMLKNVKANPEVQ